jgi:hypothetical protein
MAYLKLLQGRTLSSSPGKLKDVQIDLSIGFQYRTSALGAHDDQNVPKGESVSYNLIEAITKALDKGASSWVVKTGTLSGSRLGVISLFYICSTINQVKGGRQKKRKRN